MNEMYSASTAKALNRNRPPGTAGDTIRRRKKSKVASSNQFGHSRRAKGNQTA